MKERPILMNGEMVRKVLDGSKTQTRRLVKLPRNHAYGSEYPGQIIYDDFSALGKSFDIDELACPYGQTGDQLWVRETFAAIVKPNEATDGIGRAWYYADAEDASLVKWTPSIHMPRWASRILLEITSVRVERLQDISEDDAVAEGITPCAFLLYPTARRQFEDLWISIYGQGSWDANPWVWVPEFKVVKPLP